MSTSRSSHGTHRPDAAFSTLMTRVGSKIAERLLSSFADDDTTPRLIVERAATPTAPARFAATHRGPQAERKQLRAMYEQCLAAYRTTARPDDAARNIDDAGAALAFFVAANLSALHDVPVSQMMLDRIERQLAGLARALSNWDHATLAQRQFYFEQMAMLGAFIAGRAAKAKEGGAAARAEVRKAARSYLQHTLSIDADRITLSPQGLALRQNPDHAQGAAD